MAEVDLQRSTGRSRVRTVTSAFELPYDDQFAG